MILCIETSTSPCSVAVGDGEKLLSCKETTEKASHSAVITTFIKEALEDAGTDLSSLKAIAISKGPGSYTGLRIGVSTAKGLCYALNIPLLSVPTLQAMSHGMIERYIKLGNTDIADVIFCPMIDARRMEVYYSLYNSSNQEIQPTSAEIITAESFNSLLNTNKVIFFGDGAAKCNTLINHTNAVFIDNINPSSADMLDLAYKKFTNKEFENLAYFEPFYLKEFIAKKPVVKGLY